MWVMTSMRGELFFSFNFGPEPKGYSKKCWTIPLKKHFCMHTWSEFSELLILFLILLDFQIKIKFHRVFRLQMIFRRNCFYWGWITFQAWQSTASGPHIPRGPALPRFTLFHLLFGNLITCKFVWEYALFRHSISWTDGGLFQSPALFSTLVSLLCRDSGPFTQQLVGAHKKFLP